MNSILILLSIAVGISSPLLFWKYGSNIYVNELTVILNMLFSVINVLALSYERRNRNPFVVLLVLHIIIFFNIRVITLIITNGFAVEMTLGGVINVRDVNLCYAYIIGATLFLTAGLFSIKCINTAYGDSHKKITYRNYKIIGLIFLITLIVEYLYRLNIGFHGSQALAYYLRIFSLNNMLFISMVYLIFSKRYLYNYKNIARLFVPLFVLWFILMILIGARSGVMHIIILILVVSYAMNQRVKIRLSYSVGLAILFLLSLIIFDMATYFRWILRNNLRENLGLIDYFNMFESYLSHGLFQTQGLKHVFDRVGYLDKAVDSFTYRGVYRVIANPFYYLQSIISNLIPGSGVFDAPLAGQIKRFIPQYGRSLTFVELLSEKYSSAMFTGFGEMAIIFTPVGSLPVYFFLGRFFNKWFNRISKRRTTFLKFLYKAIVLRIFLGFFSSFGFDWLIVDLIKLLIAVYFIHILMFGIRGRHAI